ncbi:PTS fructose transporter subunit IA [Companilactobacillus nuruki]|uniref:PTS fructose transporter subunit IA n=1 Tax=Companilactobacillus nuruki TaxID=1993540 RepID=A0A2N7AS73_9LACO|nr:PTS fructose transporter subunit IA [Companilactobacillus nuruki]PMD68192.1 PTS fructose transporter subunit IA [Companilactobacillus nuruki]
MTIEEMHDGYKKEIAYQKHMLKNIGYWFQLFTAISGIGIVLIYFFHTTNIWINILGIILFIIGSIGMLLFGYTGWKGQQNIKAVIEDYENKIYYLKSHGKTKFKINK